MPKKKKQQAPPSINFPSVYHVVGGDISLKRPGFCVLTVEHNENGEASIINVKTTCVDNKKDQTKPKGQILNELLKALAFFIPDEEAGNAVTFYVREKYISSHNSTYESSIYEAVGITDWFLWGLGKTWEEIYPVTIKKLITGNGHADKAEVAAALEAYVGEREYATDDESDAVAVAIAWLIQQGQLKPPAPKEEESDGE